MSQSLLPGVPPHLDVVAVHPADARAAPPSAGSGGVHALENQLGDPR